MLHEQLRTQPLLCVISTSHYTRDHLTDAFRGAPYATSECIDTDQLADVLDDRHPDVLIVDLAANGREVGALTKVLAARRFQGVVLPVGRKTDVREAGLHDLAETLGIVVLPALPLPVKKHRLHATVTSLMTDLIPGRLISAPETLSAGAAWLELWYQPKIGVHDLTMRGAEALLRMRHPVWGVVPPNYFVAEDGNPRLAFVSETVIAQVVQDWNGFFERCGEVELAINLPIEFLESSRSVELLAESLPDHPAFRGLIIESNSTDTLRNLTRVKELARELRPHKVALSIDDLGADWPALVGLDSFPFVEIKVDRSFVVGCADDALKQSTCRQMLALARDYGARTVAEGVQSWPDFLTVRELGFDLVQGLLFAEPMEPDRFVQTCWANPPASLRQQPRALPGDEAFPVLIP